MPPAKKTERRKRRDPDETKRDSFERLAETRLKAIQDKLRVFSNLANTQHYDFEPEDVSELFSKIDDYVANARDEFESALRAKTKTRPQRKAKSK
jgi:CBS-domain-containing membrane protein